MNGWEAKGYHGIGCGELIDSLTGPALVIGSARGVFEDVKAAESMLGGSIKYVVNDSIVYAAHVDHAISLHTPRLVMWAAIRRDPTGIGYGNTNFRIHDAGLYGEQCFYQWTGLTPKMCHSGLFAATIAMLMGCNPVVLVGCPEDSTPRFFETEPRPLNYYRQAQEQLVTELNYKPQLKKVLRSMSGFTREICGSI